MAAYPNDAVSRQMSDAQTQVIEINGVKMEVDLRHAKRVDTFRVGDRVRILLKKDSYGGQPTVCSGVIVGFEPFEELPTIVVAYVDTERWSSADALQFAYINSSKASREKFEVVADADGVLHIEKDAVLAQMDRAIEKARVELEEKQERRAYFLRHFQAYFEPETA